MSMILRPRGTNFEEALRHWQAARIALKDGNDEWFQKHLKSCNDLIEAGKAAGEPWLTRERINEVLGKDWLNV